MDLSPREIATLLAALDIWRDELREGADWISESLYFQQHSPLTADELVMLIERLRGRRHSTSHGADSASWELRIAVPTYVARSNPQSIGLDLPDFASPNVPVLLTSAAGIRIVLGTHDYYDSSKPDVQFERRPHGWALFIHPNAGDPVAYVYLLDDGRTFLLREQHINDELQFIDDVPPDLDGF